MTKAGNGYLPLNHDERGKIIAVNSPKWRKGETGHAAELSFKAECFGPTPLIVRRIIAAAKKSSPTWRMLKMVAGSESDLLTEDSTTWAKWRYGALRSLGDNNQYVSH